MQLYIHRVQTVIRVLIHCIELLESIGGSRVRLLQNTTVLPNGLKCRTHIFSQRTINILHFAPRVTMVS